MENKFQEYIESDDAIFHYTNAQSALESILPKRILRLSSLQKTDDPQEYKEWRFGLVGWSLPDGIEPKWFGTSRKINLKRLKQSYTICFSKNTDLEIEDEFDPDQKEKKRLPGYLKNRMWSQYGDHHKGICLVISKKEMLSFVKEYSGVAKCDDVSYKYFDSIDTNAVTINGNDLADQSEEIISIRHIINNSQNMFFCKNIDYRDESEYRLFILDDKSDSEYKYISISTMLKGIVLGERFCDVYIPSIKELKLDVPVAKLHWDNGRWIPIVI